MLAMLVPLVGQIHSVGSVRWREKVDDRAQFDAFARTSRFPYPIRHLRFLVDRKDGGRIYYFDSRVDRHHRELANATYLSLEDSETFFKNNYLSPDRRFILGWIGYHAPARAWAFELWEGDTADSRLLKAASDAIARSFFAPVRFKPASLRLEEEARAADLSILPDLCARSGFAPLNVARGVGVLTRDASRLKGNEILIQTETPISLPPVRGLIFAHPASPLSHLGLLARNWNIPSAYVEGASTRFASLIGRTVVYRVTPSTFYLREATPEEAAEATKSPAVPTIRVPSADLSIWRLADLDGQSRASVIAYGSKSANLGEIASARRPDLSVPRGFTIPFAFYRQHLEKNGLLARCSSASAETLPELRRSIEEAPLSPALLRLLDQRMSAFGGKGVFVRSSTNAEDLDGFSGAGLYTTVPNVVGGEALSAAVRKVWASVWNDAAFASRERAGIRHEEVSMAVLVQEAVPAESAGVMVTTNPFDPSARREVYLSAKRGLGIKVVEGQRVPEQLIWNPDTGSVRVLTRSAEDSLLRIKPGGGVEEIPIDPTRNVLNDALVRRLARAGVAIQTLFGGAPQDIEWAVTADRIHILQARPYQRP